MNLIFLGAPGAGKGTQSEFISERYNIPQVSTGDILRANVREGTPLGLEAKAYMNKGALVPDALVVKMVSERIAEADCNGGFILDGFPRNTDQARSLDETLKESGKNIDHVIGIEVPKEELVSRLTGRRSCRKCAAVCHVVFNPPVKEGVCDKCGAELYQRDDDKEATILERLKVYEDQTLPLVDFYREMGLYAEVDGKGDIEQITALVVDAIGK